MTSQAPLPRRCVSHLGIVPHLPQFLEIPLRVRTVARRFHTVPHVGGFSQPCSFGILACLYFHLFQGYLLHSLTGFYLQYHVPKIVAAQRIWQILKFLIDNSHFVFGRSRRDTRTGADLSDTVDKAVRCIAEHHRDSLAWHSIVQISLGYTYFAGQDLLQNEHSL